MSENRRKDPSVTSGLGEVMGISAQMVTTTLVGGGLGWLIDGWLGTRPFVLVAGLILGGVGGIFVAWRSWTRLNP